MCKRVLVPLDGSALAEHALPMASRLAVEMNAELLLIRVAPGGMGVDSLLSSYATPIDEAEEYLASVAGPLRSSGLPVTTTVYSFDPEESILLAANVQGADLIVMSSHGRSGLRRAVLGSVAEEVLHDSTIPLLLLREPEPPFATAEGPFKKILIPLDGSAIAEQALHYIATAPFARGAELLLVHSELPAAALVVPGPVGFVAESDFERAEAEIDKRCMVARSYLEQTATQMLSDQPWQAHVAIGDPAETILRLAREKDADLITMGSHGRLGLDRVIYGGIAASVLHHTTVPLLVLHGHDTK